MLVTFLFLFSGATALVYQVAWTRNLSLIFGASHQAISIVLAAFMGGLALGGWRLGRVADRIQRPLRAYGWLEFGVGAAGLVLPLLLTWMNRAYVEIALRREGVDAGLNAIRVVFAFAVLVVPTFFMGGTLPVLTRYVVRQLGEFGPRLAWLYSVNTFGAVMGAVAAGFVLLPRLGVTRTQQLAVLANALIGTIAVLADRRRQAQGSSPPPDVDRDAAPIPAAAGGTSGTQTAPERAPYPWSLRLAFWGTFVSGLVAIALEVLWTRGISIAMGTTTYSFTIMLAAFLVGITLGSTVHALWPLRRLHEALHFGVVLAAIGVASAVVSQLVPHLPQIAVELNMRLYGGSRGMRPASTLALSFAVMLVPAFLMGIAFPLSGRARARLRAQFGRSVGDLVGLNTLGGIVGPLLAGFVLIPKLGLQKGMLLLCGLDLGFGLLVLAAYGGGRFRRLLPLAVVAGLGAAGVGIGLPWLLPRWDLHTLGAFQNNVSLGYRNAAGEIDVQGQLAQTQLLYYREGRGATVSVTESQQFRAVLINGKAVATDHYSDLHHLYLLGHLPVLLHPDPKTVLVIGLGAGVTLGGVTAHAGIDSVTLVEIEPAVLGAARVFEDLHGRALDDPRLRVVIQDGRNFLRTTPRKYDIITADPIHPWSYGAAYLYTKEYYALAQARLAPGGVMCQWMPLYELSLENLRSIVATFAAHFEYNLLFQTAFDAVLIGSNAPFGLDLPRLNTRLRQLAVATQLARIGLDDPLSFLVELTMDGDGVRRFAAPGRINTDDNLYLEFSSPLSIGTPDGGGNVDAIDALRSSPLGIVSDRGAWLDSLRARSGALEEWVHAKRLSVRITPEIEAALVNRSMETWDDVVRRLEALHAEIPAYGRVQVQLAEALVGRGMEQRAQGERAGAEASFRQALEVAPQDEHARFNLGMTLLEAGAPEAALPFLRDTVQRRDRYPRGHQALGNTLLALGHTDEAILALQKAVQSEPQNARAHLDLAVALTRGNRLERATELYQEALALDARLVEAWYNLSLVSSAQNQEGRAVQATRRGLQVDPGHPLLAERLAWLLATASEASLRDGSQAVAIATDLVQRGGTRLPEALAAQAAAYSAVGRFDEAIAAARHAADLAQQRRDPELFAQVQSQLRLYEAHRPLHP